MADNTTIRKSGNGSSALSKIFKAMGIGANGIQGAISRIRSRAWEVSGAPTVDAGSQATYPVTKGEMLYDYTNVDGYTCTVTPTADTAGTFVKLNA